MAQMNHDYQLQADPADEVFGQIAALAFIVKRLVAEQAKRFPDGVARQMIDQRDLVVQSIGFHESTAEAVEGGYVKAIKGHVDIILKDAEMLLGGRAADGTKQ